MFRRLIAAGALAVLAMALLPLILDVPETSEPGRTALAYLTEGPEAVGSANLVTAVVVTYRGLDTLGEVTVLFLATAGVGFLLRGRSRRNRVTDTGGESPEPGSELLQTGSLILFPLLLLFGVYIFIHGHLTPGGGFQGGVIMASGVLLLLLAEPSRRLAHGLLAWIEAISGFAYAGIGVAGLLLAGGFLDNRILPLGEFGSLLSAGAVPVIYSLVGLKVGTELSGILDTLREEEA